jgi:ATP-dependent Clp protease ATP-binding subunit ClpA
LEHLFLGIIDGKDNGVTHILDELKLDIEAFKQKLVASIKSNIVEKNSTDNIPLTKQTERALKFTYIVAKEFNCEFVDPEHKPKKRSKLQKSRRSEEKKKNQTGSNRFRKKYLVENLGRRRVPWRRLKSLRSRGMSENNKADISL